MVSACAFNALFYVMTIATLATSLRVETSTETAPMLSVLIETRY
jgi:hypothetical protein